MQYIIGIHMHCKHDTLESNFFRLWSDHINSWAMVYKKFDSFFLKSYSLALAEIAQTWGMSLMFCDFNVDIYYCFVEIWCIQFNHECRSILYVTISGGNSITFIHWSLEDTCCYFQLSAPFSEKNGNYFVQYKPVGLFLFLILCQQFENGFCKMMANGCHRHDIVIWLCVWFNILVEKLPVGRFF